MPRIPELLDAGIDSLKIEGRMKSAFYVATVLRAYRQIIDDYMTKGQLEDLQYWQEELEKVSHRPYTTGFYFGKPETGALTLETSRYIKPYDFIGVVIAYDAVTKTALVEQRNHFKLGDTVEFFGPQYKQFTQTLTQMYDERGNAIETAPHAQQIVRIPVENPVYPYDLLRKEVGQ